MADNSDTPVQPVQEDAPIQAVQGLNKSLSEGYQPLERKGYQPEVTTPHGLPPRSISAIIPTTSPAPTVSGGAQSTSSAHPQKK